MPPYCSPKVKKRINSVFPRWKSGEKSDRGFARELGVSLQCFQDYRKGRYWQWKEQEWNQKQAKLREAERAMEQYHIEQHAIAYREDLEKMQKRLADLSHAHAGIAAQLAQISGQAAIALSQEVQKNPNRAAAVCTKVQKEGIAQTALDSTRISKEARENFAEAYGLRELLDHLEAVLDNLNR